MVQKKLLENVLEKTSVLLLVIIEVLAGAGPFVSYFFGLSTSQLWSMFEGMQILVNYPMLKINAPANLGII
jgi:hypothetical protein